MKRLAKLYGTTVGKKIVVAVTGIVLLGFLIGHVLGNLKAMTGMDEAGVPHVDAYAQFLRTVGEPAVPHTSVLWAARAVILVALIAHVWTIVLLTVQNRQARPIKYQRLKLRQATVPARSMLLTGMLLLVFVVIHLAHFTFGRLLPTEFAHGAVYANLMRGFSLWSMTLFYVVAMGLVGLHVYHGAWSLFQTLGIDNPDRNRPLRLLAAAAAFLLFLGFSAVPAYFFLGMGEMPGEHVALLEDQHATASQAPAGSD